MPLKTIQETSLDVVQPSDNAQVVMATRNLARMVGFDLARQFLIASAVSELSTNIIRYAGRGNIILRMVQLGDMMGLEVEARDQGPGIGDIGKAMQEHYSTGKGLGLGLSSVKRIMDYFHIHSKPDQGTVIRAGKWRS